MVSIFEYQNVKIQEHVDMLLELINIDNISITIAESYWTIIHGFVYIF